MSDVVFFKESTQLKTALSYFDLDSFSDKKVPLKLHMGEKKNPHFLRPELVQQVISELKACNINPFLFDTTVAYPGPRSTKEGYLQLAIDHGFSKDKVGCDTEIADTGIDTDLEGYTFEVAPQLVEASHIVALTHCKGHIQVGFGGAIKNFGMGGVTHETKKMIHHASNPVYYKDNCTLCGVCAELCPFDAIEITNETLNMDKKACFGCGVCVDNCPANAMEYKKADLQFLISLAAKACLQDKKTLFINELKRMARSCDCDPFPGPVIAPDIGFLVGDDPVAIDNASLDLIHEKKPDVFKKANGMDSYKQIKFGEEVDLGTSSYNIIKI